MVLARKPVEKPMAEHRRTTPNRHRKAPTFPTSKDGCTSTSVDTVDTSYLETLIGYNARRAALSVIGLFLQRMAVYGLRPVDFSVLSLITHNPGITSRQSIGRIDG